MHIDNFKVVKTKTGETFFNTPSDKIGAVIKTVERQPLADFGCYNAFLGKVGSKLESLADHFFALCPAIRNGGVNEHTARIKRGNNRLYPELMNHLALTTVFICRLFWSRNADKGSAKSDN